MSLLKRSRNFTSKVGQFRRLNRELHNYFSNVMTLNSAKDSIKGRMENRENRFLETANSLIYQNSRSPYRKLLLWAGCEYDDLATSVRTKGIENTLASLKNEGVYVNLEEFKSQIPIRRKGLLIETQQMDFDNPLLMGEPIEGTTSGSRSKGSRVKFDWAFFEEEAANELLLYHLHGILDSPLAFWLPSLPAISGVHNFFMSAKYRRTPEKWFSQLEGGFIRFPNISQLAMEYIFWRCRKFGIMIPRPEFVDAHNAGKVARWMAGNTSSEIRVLRTYTSSAVRLVQAAEEQGIDISGSVIFAGGEPLTEKRYQLIKSAGVRVFPRYVTTETGLVAAACEDRRTADDMHVYLDRLAIIQKSRETRYGNDQINGYAFSTLSSNSGKVLLNTDLGDFGEIETRSCHCPLGELGMNIRISNVRSHDKLTGEGITLIGTEFDGVLTKLIQKAGGGPDDYQFWETQDDKGRSKVVIAISPKVGYINEGEFVRAVLDVLRQTNQNSRVAADIWNQVNTLTVIRAEPEYTKGFKLLPIIKKNPGG